MKYDEWGPHSTPPFTVLISVYFFPSMMIYWWLVSVRSQFLLKSFFQVREPILLLLISALAVLALPSSDLYSHYLLLLKELFMFETMKRKQSNSNVFNLLVDGCYFIVSGAQWPVCTLYIYNFTCVSFWKLSCNINGSGYVAEKDYPTVSYRFLSTVWAGNW